MNRRALSLPQRLVRASDDRRTRFHSARGDLMPLPNWLRLPKLVALRLSRRDRHRPWIVPRAVDWLDEYLERSYKVLELGAGYSTRWLAERASVLSLETDRGWYEKIHASLVTNAVHVEYVEPQDLLERVRRLPNDEFDLVYVDTNEGSGVTRVDCVSAASGKVKPGGALLLDDSDRAAYRNVDRVLRDWDVMRFVGPKPRPLMTVETTVFRRPLGRDGA